MNNIENLNPAEVFKYFKKICSIPHGSSNTKALSDYCVDFAKQHNYKYVQDKSNNVIIFAEGTKDYKNSETVILQGHLDMVCDKSENCKIDMDKEPLELCTDGKFIFANGTTLGGDDGIAIAYMLALLSEKNIPHPPIEALFTVDEEIGMLGVRALDTGLLKGKRLINIDSEEEGVLTVSCAGGMRATCSLPIESQKASGVLFEINIRGLTGGHSGIDINCGRTNANKLLGRMLNFLHQEVNFLLCSVSGGKKDNTIPCEATATVCVREEYKQLFSDTATRFAKIVKKEKQNTEPFLTIDCRQILKQTVCMNEHSTQKILFVLLQIPNGVQTMSPDIPNMVQTSLNLGVVRTESQCVTFNFLLRSNAATGKQALLQKLQSFVEYLDGHIEFRADYPAWEYRADSKLRDIMVKTYNELYGSSPVVTAIHAGLECGILAGKIQNMDGVSFGPNIYNAHTPKEKLEIASVERCWEYLKTVLKNLL